MDGEHQRETIQRELNRLRLTLTKREEWLSQKQNMLRKTWPAVLQDTRELKRKITELEYELNTMSYGKENV